MALNGTNNLVELPEFSVILRYLDCHNNQISRISFLPNTLKYLICNNNNSIQLPELPSSLVHFRADKIEDEFEYLHI